MPYELRVMLFDTEEVTTAVRAYRGHVGAELPAGEIMSAEPERQAETGDVQFRIVVAPRGARSEDLGMPPLHCVTRGHALAAALIHHCQRARIPLPAASAKSLQLILGMVGFVLTTPDLAGKPVRMPQLSDR